MNIVKFNGKEYDLKAARGKAIPVITVTQEQISDLDVEIIGQYESREDEMHVVVPHEGQYVFTDFSEPGTSYVRSPSLWEVRVGFNYKF